MLVPLLAAALVPKVADAVVYEANLRAEGPSGGFTSLTRRLDSIKALGVNVLWLMPVQPVGKLRSAGGLGSPYATRDYDAVNPEFGTPDDLKRLVAEAHRRKIAVILDWVANHTAWDHPWIAAHPDWYTHDAQGQITRPAGTNWNDVADLDYSKPALRAAMITSMKGWIDRYGIDGFRTDTADWLPADFWKEAITRLRRDTPRPLFMLAEGFRREHADSGFDLEYGWPFYDDLVKIFRGGKATTLAGAAAKEKANGLPHLRFVTNHDKAAWEGTTRDFFRTPTGIRAATVVTALYGGGVPLVYSGQEVAWPQRIPIFDRSSIDWSSSPDERRWLARLLTLRAQHPALRDGTTLDLSTDDVIAFVRQKARERILVVANVRDRAIALPIPADLRGSAQEALQGRRATLGETLNLQPFACAVYVRASR